MGTQTAIARTIRNKGADYVLCVKDNHPKLTESILLTLAGLAGKGKAIRLLPAIRTSSPSSLTRVGTAWPSKGSWWG
jgi:hypothetical protein